MQAAAHWLAIPPGDANYRTDAATVVLQEKSELVGMRAHMHLRGKSIEFRAVYPNGESEILLEHPQVRFQLAALLLPGDAQAAAARHAHRSRRGV